MQTLHSLVALVEQFQVDAEARIGFLRPGNALEEQVERCTTVDHLDARGDMTEHAALCRYVIARYDTVEHLLHLYEQGQRVARRVDADDSVATAVHQSVDDTRGDAFEVVGRTVGLQA